MPPDRDPRDALVALVRDEGPRVLAGLRRSVGDLALAEDAVQDATLRALADWSAHGVPANPRAWLTLTARRRAIDLVRREAARGGKEADASALADLGRPDLPEPAAIRDDLLRLLFTVCHPCLAVEAQAGLALRTLCGLRTDEVARTLLVNEAAMAKRLTRARAKIAAAGVPYRAPAPTELPRRLHGVAATIYLLFTEGYDAVRSDDPLRAGLCDQAVRLGRLLCELLPDEAAPLGLLSLMLLHDSRRAARRDPDGSLIPLADQDRRRWDRGRILEGMTLLGTALRRTPVDPDPYVVQAAIAACHVIAPSFDATDWGAIVSWYDVLVRIHDTPVVRLNRAVAVAHRDGWEPGLAALDAIVDLDDYAPLHASRSEMLLRLGRLDEAADTFERATRLGVEPPVARRFAEQLAEARALQPATR